MRLVAGREDREVKPAVCRELADHVVGRRGVVAVARGERDALQRVLIERRQHVARGALLEHAPQLIDLAQVARVQLGHEVAAARPVGDLPLLLEHAQRLTQRGNARAELFGDLILVDALAGCQRAGEDHHAQRLDSVLLRGRRHRAA